jgi:hypothetical protein
MLKLDESAQNGDPASVSSPFANDERWLLVQRIIASKYFIKALQLRDILIYVTSQVLSDEKIAIPEHEIACKVLGRRESFNPNDDNIVRVQAGHLRRKLDQYFSTEGREEPYILIVPKGTYVPHFVLRQRGGASDSAGPSLHLDTVEPQATLATAISTSSNVKTSLFGLHTEISPGLPSYSLSDEPAKSLKGNSEPIRITQWFWFLVACWDVPRG